MLEDAMEVLDSRRTINDAFRREYEEPDDDERLSSDGGVGDGRDGIAKLRGW